MLNCPQVALDEIYAVPVQRKIDALGADGLETMEEAAQANHDEDLTLPPHNSEVIVVHVCVWPAVFLHLFCMLTLGGGQEGTVGVWISKMTHTLGDILVGVTDVDRIISGAFGDLISFCCK